MLLIKKKYSIVNGDDEEYLKRINLLNMENTYMATLNNKDTGYYV